VGHVHIADLIVVGEFLVFLAALALFVVYYVVSSRGEWRRSPEGRHLVSFRSSLVLFGSMGVVHNLVPPYPGEDVVRCTVVGLTALCAVHGAVLVVRAQVANRRRLAGLEPHFRQPRQGQALQRDIAEVE
jgi:hypothetical protein